VNPPVAGAARRQRTTNRRGSVRPVAAAAAFENALLRALRTLGQLHRNVGRDEEALRVCERVLEIEERRLRLVERGEVVIVDPTKLATDPRLLRGLPQVETATSAAAKAGYAARNERDPVLGTLKVNIFNSFQYSYDFTLRFDILNIF